MVNISTAPHIPIDDNKIVQIKKILIESGYKYFEDFVTFVDPDTLQRNLSINEQTMSIYKVKELIFEFLL